MIALFFTEINFSNKSFKWNWSENGKTVKTIYLHWQHIKRQKPDKLLTKYKNAINQLQTILIVFFFYLFFFILKVEKVVEKLVHVPKPYPVKEFIEKKVHWYPIKFEHGFVNWWPQHQMCAWTFTKIWAQLMRGQMCTCTNFIGMAITEN